MVEAASLITYVHLYAGRLEQTPAQLPLLSAGYDQLRSYALPQVLHTACNVASGSASLQPLAPLVDDLAFRANIPKYEVLQEGIPKVLGHISSGSAHLSAATPCQAAPPEPTAQPEEVDPPPRTPRKRLGDYARGSSHGNRSTDRSEWGAVHIPSFN